MFFCGPEQEAKKRVQKLEGLKEVVEKIEEKMLVPCSLLCCPLCSPPCLVNQEPVKPAPPPPPEPPNVMVCYKVEKKKNCQSGKKSNNNRPKRKKRAKSRELRASILYQGCDCEKRNGLQDDCRRTGCHGSPECLTKPEPICGPSEFSNGKHLGKMFNAKRGGLGGTDDDLLDDNGKVTVHYNCYPAAITC